MNRIINIVERIWSENPYPSDIFIEPTRKQFLAFNKWLSERGIEPDAYNGSIARRTWENCCARILKRCREECGMSDKRPPITEQVFQSQIVELAHLFGFTVLEIRKARTKRSWRTPWGADGEGYPDLTMFKSQRRVAIEVKSEKGKLSDHQQLWLDILAVAGFETYVFRPSHYDLVVEILHRGITPQTPQKRRGGHPSATGADSVGETLTQEENKAAFERGEVRIEDE